MAESDMAFGEGDPKSDRFNFDFELKEIARAWKIEERRRLRERSLEFLVQLGTTDPEPNGVAPILDIGEWCRQYRARLELTDLLAGRNSSIPSDDPWLYMRSGKVVTDKTVLQTLSHIMEKNAQRVFPASERYIYIYTGIARQTLSDALNRLRANQYIRRVRRDKASHAWCWALMDDKLASLEEAASVLGILSDEGAVLTTSGDFAHDAFSFKAFSKTRRSVYSYLLAHPGEKIVEIEKALPQTYNTIKTALLWLEEQRLVDVDGKSFYPLPFGPEELSHIAQRCYTTGQRQERTKLFDLGWEMYKKWRQENLGKEQVRALRHRILPESMPSIQIPSPEKMNQLASTVPYSSTERHGVTVSQG